MTTESRDLTLREVTFRTLWAFAFVFHQLSSQRFPLLWGTKGIFSTAALELAIYLLSALVILYPKSNSIWGGLLSLFVLYFLLDLPFVSNHLQIEALVSIALLISLLRGETLPIRSLRLATVVVYFWVTVHKLNWDFFKPEVSCANLFAGNILKLFSLPDAAASLGVAMPIITVATEAVICLLLLIPRFSVFGVILGALFHFALGLDETKRFYNFSSPMFALLILFLPERFFERVAKSGLRLALRRHLAAAAVALLVLFHFGTPGWNSLAVQRISFGGIFLVWLILSALFTCTVVRFARRTAPGFEAKSPLRQVWLPLLFFLIGTGPYVGFRTRSAFDMYSNLGVRTSWTNHLFLPSLDFFRLIGNGTQGQQRNLPLGSIGNLEPDLNPARFEQLMREDFSYNGSESNGRISRPLHSIGRFLIAKLIWFRPIDTRANERCQW
jgi:hypothetical protein